MKFKKMLGVGIAASMLFAGAATAEARGGGFAGGGPRFIPHAPYVGNGYFGRTGRPVGRFLGGRRLGAVGLGLLGAGVVGLGAYNYYGGDYGYEYPYEDACTRATANPQRCNSYQYGY